jgi:DNA mismatch endonuclease (patch repair protein)
MSDIFTKAHRSKVMSRIKSSGTSPETKLLSLIRRSIGHRWRVQQNVCKLPGRPDIIMPSLRLAIFVDGCFYHVCPRHGHLPKSNQAYWIPKLLRNKQRDKANRLALRRAGFCVWRFWEHDFKPRDLPLLEKRLSRRFAKHIASVRRQEA